MILRLFLFACIAGQAQDPALIVKQGEEVFQASCSSGYCHGPKGIGAGGPRLASRGFEQKYIETIVSRGISGTSMPAFADRLSAPDRIAVIAYVATLNGIVNPMLNPGQGSPVQPIASPLLSTQALKGRELFYDPLRSSGFGRCSVCHQVKGVGIPVTTAITRVPPDVRALKTVDTPRIKTITVDDIMSPALIIRNGSQRTIYYDLSLRPPVQRNVATTRVRITDGSPWRHSSVIATYDDAELASILIFLRAEVNP